MDPNRLAPQHLHAIAAAALPLAAWGAHATVMRRRLDRARRDPLTGLLTRDGFTREAERLIRHQDAAVLFIDLDHFKQANDTHGHAAGDAILKDTAAHLTHCTGGYGHVARFGGDEFAIIRPLPRNRADGKLYILNAYLNEPVAYAGLSLPRSASIGMALVADLPDRSLETALAAADTAMYQAKRAGGGWQQYTPGTDLATADRRWRRTRTAA
ncbi:diguanylate cyclase (GGDEF)-like protein [Streptomyces sp. 1114.5]|uniref:GGDEF domain-containing protein n=1 Tax=Streptomyces sp. 1114.5 TaxID=1938830 RepID=UPI000EB1E185|nr:GGDEF domain-containing protein [Streptomyces sp. 1114.5]RKT18145.1 diguanylate cyclase (GGDEF)-like protein [Streptomyces sp. 1114.5]